MTPTTNKYKTLFLIAGICFCVTALIYAYSIFGLLDAQQSALPSGTISASAYITNLWVVLPFALCALLCFLDKVGIAAIAALAVSSYTLVTPFVTFAFNTVAPPTPENAAALGRKTSLISFAIAAVIVALIAVFSMIFKKKGRVVTAAISASLLVLLAWYYMYYRYSSVFVLNELLGNSRFPDEMRAYYIYLLDTMPLQRMVTFAIAGVSGFLMMVGIILRNRADLISESAETDDPTEPDVYEPRSVEISRNGRIDYDD